MTSVLANCPCSTGQAAARRSRSSGKAPSNSIFDAGGTSRVFEIIGDSSLSVVFQSLGIEGGDATDGGFMGLNAAVGGGLLIDGGQVAMSNVALMNNEAAGLSGSNGGSGHSATSANPTGAAGGAGGAGGNAQGGGIYLYAGSLTLTHDTIAGNIAQGGTGGAGGGGGYGYSSTHVTTPSGGTFNEIGFHSGNGGSGGNGGVGGGRSRRRPLRCRRHALDES